MKGRWMLVRNQEKEPWNIKRVVFIREIGMKIKEMEQAPYGHQAIIIKAIGKMIKWMEKALLRGKDLNFGGS